MAEYETTDERERRELGYLLWFFWVGILIAVAAESTLVFMMQRAEGVAAADSANHLWIVGGLAALMWSGAALVYRQQLGGGGLPTALFCWMLAKATAILSFVMYFLTPSFNYSLPLLTGFVLVMVLLRPQKFLPA